MRYQFLETADALDPATTAIARPEPVRRHSGRGSLGSVSELVEDFEAQRPRLFWLSYRLLGSASEAEDAVQDAYLRLHGADPAFIESLPAWLTKAVTNLCLNRLTSARARPAVYPRPWLPEPVPTPHPPPRTPETAP